MSEKDYYSIGEVSKICNISKKALRFYEELGIIAPDKVDESNNYRYYDRGTLLHVPVIKYYKQIGFKLEEIHNVMESASFDFVEKHFRAKLDELVKMQEKIARSYCAVKDWYNLILEAEQVVENNISEVSVKFMNEQELCFLEQPFEYNYKESIINIEWTNFLESIKNEITGPVILNFENCDDKIEGKDVRAKIMQKTMLPMASENAYKAFGNVYACCYHIGRHEDLDKTYQKIKKWVGYNKYECLKESYERYVVDYWTCEDPNLFVTEVMVKVKK